MSREVRRVPLDFDWPERKVWHGYLMPNSLIEDKCPDCDRGETAAREWLGTLASRLGMLASDIGDQQRGRPLHPWLAEDRYPPTSSDYVTVLRPSADILDLVAGLTGEAPEKLTNPLRGPVGDWHIARKIIEAAGLNPETWGICPTCHGHGSIEKYPGQREDAEAWERADPPTGDGWQLWETTSEGSPISPVFPTADGLARWLSSPAAGRDQVPYGAAEQFVAAGWAPTFVSTPETGLVTGIQYVGHRTGDQR